MIRLTRYIKPYLGFLLLAILLLFVQANAELALPDYMSRIVNTGIQQGGVENAVPLAVRESTMNGLLLFMNPGDTSLVMGSYTRVIPGSSEAARHLGDYPALASETVYIRDRIDAAVIGLLDPILSRAFLVLGGLEALGTAPERIASMEESARSDITDTIIERFGSMEPGSAAARAASIRIRSEYESLGMDSAVVQRKYIFSVGGWMLLLTLVSGLTTVLVGYLSARIAAGLSRDLRSAVFTRVEDFSSAEFDRFSTASLITRTTNDVMQIQMVAVMMVRMVFYAPIIGIGGIIRAVGKSSSMWWIIAAAVGVLSVLILVIFTVAVPKFKVIQKLMDRLNLVSRESLSGMMVIRAFNMQRHEEERFDKANQDLTDTTLFVNRVMMVMMPVMMMIMNGVSVLIIWVGARQVAAASMQVGDMMAFLQYTMQIVFSFLMLSMMFIMLPRAAVSADRIAEVLESEPSIDDPEDPENFGDGFSPVVEFRDVGFRYPGAEADALCGISFTALPGRTTALIGATGSGKSTVVNLIPRFYDVSEGSILVGGKDVRTVTQHSLRDRIGLVPQRSTLFSGTIASNLRYADENASEEDIAAASSVSQADEFIESSAEGLETAISQGGANVSGGQKQRLSIARALVKSPPIYIFDDSFSALDFKTDAALRRALKSRTARSTVLIVSQRVSTIRNADQIIVLDNGRIAGLGTHRELMESCETYREIALSQLTEEELA